MMQIRVDYKSGKPLHLQLMAQIKAAAASNALRPSEPLPSIASLSQELRINRNAVAKAYSELEMMGLIESLPGKGYCLREQHRPSRKGVRRALGDGKAQAMAHAPIAFEKTLKYFLLKIVLGALYLALVGGIAMFFVHSGLFKGESLAVLATILVAAVLLPVRGFVQKHVDRLVFAKRHEALRAVQRIKAEAPVQPDLDSFMELVSAVTVELFQSRLELVQERAAVQSLVNSFPSLRSAFAPLQVDGDLLAPVFTGDEVFGILRLTGKTAGMVWSAEAEEFMVSLSEQAAMVVSQLHMRNEGMESEYALDIQRGLLPRELPQLIGFSIAGAWQPSKTVGGDYYDAFKLSETKLALVIADVSGKGIPAALLMSNVQATAKAFATLGSSPQDLCSKVNRAICSSITPGKFITFFYAVLDSNGRRLSYTNAGHNPPIIVSQDQGCKKLETGGTVLGLFAEGAYDQASIDLLPGDRLVMFTDGITEATDSNGEEFGEQRLIELVRKYTAASASELRDAIMQDVTQFCQGDFADDATLLTVVVDQ